MSTPTGTKSPKPTPSSKKIPTENPGSQGQSVLTSNVDKGDHKKENPLNNLRPATIFGPPGNVGGGGETEGEKPKRLPTIFGPPGSVGGGGETVGKKPNKGKTQENGVPPQPGVLGGFGRGGDMVKDKG